jgi:hypothetical protein
MIDQLRRIESPLIGQHRRLSMNEEEFNLIIRKFLKVVGIGSQREIERAVAQAIAEGKIADSDHFPARMTLVVDGLDINVSFDGEIKLQ